MVACPLPVIGVVHSDRSSAERTPVQAALNRAEHGTVEIFADYADGLIGFEGFDYAWLLSWLHQPDGTAAVGDEPAALVHVPFLLRGTGRRLGIFATRGPRRVNPIGLSLVEIRGVTGRSVHFAGVDLLDGTPVIDLKPYVSHFDYPGHEVRSGWFDEVPLTEGVTPSDLGPR
jgi:tRNA-Thr(GGU) m(6)t(6)A37 methyltransferase TsaA